MRNILVGTACIGGSVLASVITGQSQDPPIPSVPFHFTVLSHTKTKSGYKEVWSCIYDIRSAAEPFKISVTTPGGPLVLESPSACPKFLQALSRALMAKSVPSRKGAHRGKVVGTLAILGERQSRQSDGSFRNIPPGTWTAAKAFVGDADEGEFFLDWNPRRSQAEIGLKDPGYATYLMRKFAIAIGK